MRVVAMNMMIMAVACIQSSLDRDFARKLVTPIYRVYPVCGFASYVSDCKSLLRYVNLSASTEELLRWIYLVNRLCCVHSDPKSNATHCAFT
jgi:hypothetical protein